MNLNEKLSAAHAAYKAENFVLAIEEAKAALALDSDSHKAHQIISLSSRARGDWAGAVQAIEAAVKLAPRDAECLNSYGNIMVAINSKTEAVTAYKTALEVAPNYPQPAIALGQFYLREKDPISAASVFETALSYSPDHIVLLKGLVFALNDAQQFELASELLGKIPPAPDTAFVAGEIAIARRQKPVAEANLVRALSFPPSSVVAFRALVQMRLQAESKGDESADEDAATQAAAELIEKFTQDNPEAGVFYLAGAELLSEMERHEAALALTERAKEKFGDNPDIHLLQAKLLVEAGQGEAAYAMSEKALQGRPGDLAVMAHLSRAALMVGRPDVALNAARSAQQRQADNQFWTAIETTAHRAMGEKEAYARLYDYELVKSYDMDPPAEYENAADFIAKLKEALLALHTHKERPLGFSLRGGTRTRLDLRFAQDRVIQDFFQSLADPMRRYMEAMPDDPSHPLTRRRLENYRLTGAWSVNLSGEGFHVNHMHPEGWVSAAFYVDVPKGMEGRKDKAGWLAFGKPPFTVRGQDGNLLGAEHMIAPAAGRLVLFPSYMWHGTVPLREKDSSRLTLSFETAPA